MKKLAASVALILLSASLSWGAMTYFFTATDGFDAYYDPSSVTMDANGYHHVTVTLQDFRPGMRSWLQTNFPQAANATYGLDEYTINCADRTEAEGVLRWMGSDGTVLEAHDFGTKFQTPPVPNSMKVFLIRRVCGD